MLKLTLMLALVMAACSAPNAEAALARPLLGAPLSCDDPIAAFDDLPEDFSAVSGVVAFPTDPLLGRGRAGPDNDPESARRFSKFGLFVRAGAVFEIHVAGESQANALLHWGNVGPSDPVSSIAVDSCQGSCDPIQPACTGGEERKWIVFPGGVWTLEPACTSLVVVTDGKRTQVKLPIGEACS